MFFGNIVLAVALAASPTGRHLASLPMSWLLLSQWFRLPLELALHRFAEAGSIPTAMSWGGQNLDVVTPLLAFALAPFCNRYPRVAIIFELVGLAMLVNIFRIVMQHTPGSPLWLGEGTVPLLLGAYVPFHLIVTVCVFTALLGHFVILRKLVFG